MHSRRMWTSSWYFWAFPSTYLTNGIMDWCSHSMSSCRSALFYAKGFLGFLLSFMQSSEFFLDTLCWNSLIISKFSMSFRRSRIAFYFVGSLGTLGATLSMFGRWRLTLVSLCWSRSLWRTNCWLPTLVFFGGSSGSAVAPSSELVSKSFWPKFWISTGELEFTLLTISYELYLLLSSWSFSHFAPDDRIGL